MSTLKTANIQDTSGGNNSTPEEIYSGRAKAWVNFDGTGTVAIRTSFNVSSITDNGTGDYTVNFTNPMVDADFAYTYALGEGDHTSSGRTLSYISSTTSTLQFLCENTATGANNDEPQACIAIFR